MMRKLAPLPTTLVTAVLATASALSLTACLGDADLAEPAAPMAADASCQWLRQTDRLEARLALDYRHQAALVGGGHLQRHHVADVHGELRLLQRDAAGAVWSGPLGRGRMQLEDRQRPPGGSEHRLSGRGAPATGPGLSGTVATIRVDFATCSLQLAARLALPATAQQGSATPLRASHEMGRLTLSGLDARGAPVLAGGWRVPVSADDEAALLGDAAAAWDDGVTLGRYRPTGLRDEAIAAGGHALVRWQFRARA